MKNQIKRVLVVPAAKYKQSMPADKLDVLFMDYDGSYEYNSKNSKWDKIKPTPTEWNVTHKARGSRIERRIANYYDVQNQYPHLFNKGTALRQSGVTQVGSTLVISGQTPLDVIEAYLTGEIPTKNGTKFIK